MIVRSYGDYFLMHIASLTVCLLYGQLLPVAISEKVLYNFL